MFASGKSGREDMDSEEELAEAILYLSFRLPRGSAAGATKLNKLLFFAEFAHMRETGRPITGVEYQRLPNGPAPRLLRPVRNRLEQCGDARVEREEYLGRFQDRVIALRDTDPEAFSDTERAAFDEVLRAYATYTGGELSDLSHLEPAWDFFEENETIPFEMAFLSDRRPSRAAYERARELAEKHAQR